MASTKRKRDDADSQGILPKQADLPAFKGDMLARLGDDVLKHTFSYLDHDVRTLKALRQVSKGLKANVANLLPKAEAAIATHEIRRYLKNLNQESVHPALAAILPTLTTLTIEDIVDENDNPAYTRPYITNKIRKVLDLTTKLQHIDLYCCLQDSDLQIISSALQRQDELISLIIYGYLDPTTNKRALWQVVHQNKALQEIRISDALLSDELMRILTSRNNLTKFVIDSNWADLFNLKLYTEVIKSNKNLEDLYLLSDDDSAMGADTLNKALEAAFDLRSLKESIMNIFWANKETVQIIEKASQKHRLLKRLTLVNLDLSNPDSLLAAAAYLRCDHQLQELEIQFI